MRRALACLFALVAIVPFAAAEAPKLRWTKGQELLYQIEMNTTATEQVAENTSETKTAIKVTKRWVVTDVDTTGTATLSLSLTSMHHTRSSTTGSTLTYDSANPDKSEPEFAKAMAGYLNTTLAVLRVDATGKVVEVKESKSPASSHENELPFVGVLPTVDFKQGLTWERGYQITLAPPLGTGEKYDAVQKYTCNQTTGDAAVVSLTTDLKTPPKAAADAIPTWQMLPTGELVYDLKNGRLYSAKLTVQRELKGHQGENSVYKLTTTQTVQYSGK